MLKFIEGRPAMLLAEGDPAPGGGGDAAAAAAAAAAAPKPWYEGAAAEDVGYFQNRGWDKLDAKGAALEAAKAHRNAEKMLGHPADKMVRLPADANDAEGWRQVRLKLGAPQDAKGYDFTAIKHADGSPLEEAFANTMKERALRLGLKPSDALEFVSDLVKMGDESEGAEATEVAGKLAAEKTKLAENWGSKYAANEFVAKQTAAALGVTPEQVSALEKMVGYAAAMEMFRNIGTKIGEDKFVLSPGGGANQIMTKEQAVDRKDSLMKDTVWVSKYNSGDTAAFNEMLALNKMIVGG